MNKFFNTCKKCLNPWVVGIIILVVIGLFILVPVLGFASLIAALPLIGCTVMCGAMVFLMRPNKGEKKD